ncbi:MAG: YicC family protein, partial [Gammaproteobacteria bacterium]|nr:YicC family protein [Gammaproteobacteria bacterium]
MTYSMTAFARQSEEQPWGSLVWEVRSVNHRYLDLTVRIPEELRSIEMAVREAVAARLSRGKVECNLRFQPSRAHTTELQVNDGYVKAVLDACQLINKKLHQPSEMNLMDILSWPGVVEEPTVDLAPVKQSAVDLLHKTLDDLVESRQREGDRLQEMVLLRRNTMLELVQAERVRRPELLRLQREKLLGRVKELQANPDMDRFEQELLYLTQKMDVDEELDRLESHFKELD